MRIATELRRFVRATHKMRNVGLYFSGMSDELPRVQIADRTLSMPGDLEWLKTQMQPSLVGRDDENVLEEEHRKSLELENSRFGVEWHSLPAVLERVADALAPNMQLSASVGKLVLYANAGDKFQAHRDSEHVEGHLLSLVVDLSSNATGGDVEFLLYDPLWRTQYFDQSYEDSYCYDDEDGSGEGAAKDDKEAPIEFVQIDETRGGAAVWRSRPRAFAAWYASTWHSVSELTAGHRLVLTYDITATPRPSARSLLPSREFRGAAPFAQLVWERLADFLTLRERVQLAATCKNLYALLGGVAALLASLLPDRAQYAAQLRAKGYFAIGVVCEHSYLFKTGDTAPRSAWTLKGRDRIVAEALRLAGWLDVDKCLPVRRAFVEQEIAQSRGVVRVRVGCGEIDKQESVVFRDLRFRGSEMDEDERRAALQQCEATYEKIAAMTGVPAYRPDVRDLGEPMTECDNGIALPTTVPFCGVYFAETLGSVQRIGVARCNAHQSSLWGNQSMFGIAQFEACVLVVPLLEPSSVAKLKPTPDFRVRWMFSKNRWATESDEDELSD